MSIIFLSYDKQFKLEYNINLIIPNVLSLKFNLGIKMKMIN